MVKQCKTSPNDESSCRLKGKGKWSLDKKERGRTNKEKILNKKDRGRGHPRAF